MSYTEKTKAMQCAKIYFQCFRSDVRYTKYKIEITFSLQNKGLSFLVPSNACLMHGYVTKRN